MLLLIDECIAPTIAKVFADAHHTLLYIVKVLGRSTKDPVVAKYASDREATVVTWNRKHFQQLMFDKTNSGAPLFPGMGLISLRGCGPALQVPQRVRDILSTLEFEYAEAQKRADKRLHVLVEYTKVTVYR